MKKLMMLSMSFLMVIYFTTLSAQDAKQVALNSKKNSNRNESKIEKKEFRKAERNLVSVLSKDAFMADFGNISNVIWERDHLFDVALYTKDGNKYKAFYDINSKLVGTTSDKSFTDLPKYAQNEIKKEYKDFTIDKVIFFEDNSYNSGNMLLYGMQFDDADNYFVELSNIHQNKNIILQVNPEGDIFFFKELKKKI